MIAPLAALVLVAAPPPISWEHDATAAFAKAKAEHKLVLLDLEAIWCHWCHVQDETTYADAKVEALVASKYVALRVDQDADPALAARYDRWGWPATIIFGADGQELIRRRGYIPPPGMAALLQAVIDDPTPGPSVFADPEPARDAAERLSADEHTLLAARLAGLYDEAHAGWGGPHKLIDLATTRLAFAGDAVQKRRAQATLDAARLLIDPVWGGMAQYSAEVNWRDPHFEKLASSQAVAIEAYATAFRLWQRPTDLESARAVHRYVTAFLRAPDGGFFTSQDADLSAKVEGHAYYALDDAGRRKLGIPHIDPHEFAGEAGQLIATLCALADVGDDAALAEAKAAATWVLAHRRRPDGLFAHGEDLRAPPALIDSLEVMRGMVALASSTGDYRWIVESEATLRAAGTTFASADGLGFLSIPVDVHAPSALARPIRRVDENAEFAELADALEAPQLAARARRYCAGTARTELQRPLPEALLADASAEHKPVHVVVVGEPGDAATESLFAAARRAPVLARRLERWDPRTPRPTHLPEFPKSAHAAAFICGESSCSPPIRAPEKVAPTMAALGAGG